MFLEKVRSEGLAHISYLVGSNGQAAVIDPRRDVDEYLDIARKKGARIMLVLETHRNEDLVSGALELANATGAAIYHGGQLDFDYGNSLEDGQEFSIGDLRITAMHTPGHTDESHCFLLADGRGPFLLFTGDTLFSGEVGRTDLLGPERLRDMTEKLYDSLHDKVLPLGEGTVIMPAHGPGSHCGHAIGERSPTTIGLEVRDNKALSLPRMDFIMAKMADRMERPPYFKRMEALNLHGPIILGAMPSPPALGPGQVKGAQEDGALVLDLREPQCYANGHIPRSLNVWLDRLPAYGGYAIPYGRPLLLVLDRQEDVDTAVRYLVRMGYEDICGYLRDGMNAWAMSGNVLSSFPAYSVHDVHAAQLSGKGMMLIDLRDTPELEAGLMPGSSLIHLGNIIERSSELPADKELVLFCRSGTRGAIAASMLRNSGMKNVAIMLGGFTAWSKNGYPVEKFRNV
ncbi:MAG: MBL fold metallo-hydrolase [Methanomassiliicoccales archaeon]|nr:MBL fold metallo-hydrolase [Methanomassiliicoccales archaeon]